MPLTRRRTRRPDPLASRTAVRAVLAQLQRALGPASPQTEKDFVRLLRATGHAARHPQVSSTRGRKSRWSDYDKSRVRLLLTDLLARGTKRVAVRSFLEHYLLILDFPADVAEALEAGTLNLFEAEQLARLSAKRLGLPEAKSRQRRQAFLKAHLQTQASGIRLKAKVDAALQLVRPPAAAPPLPQAAIRAAAAGQAVLTELAPPIHEWLESLPPEHLFGEYLHLIGSLLCEIRAEELQATELNRIAELAEPLIRYLNILYKLQHAPASEDTSQAVPRRFFI
jgi:hypothetical protein